jgi:hypothetical protein
MIYLQSVWNPGHLYLVLVTVVGVIRERFCCCQNTFEPGKATFCSESPDEDTLVQLRRRIALLR